MRHARRTCSIIVSGEVHRAHQRRLSQTAAGLVATGIPSRSAAAIVVASAIALPRELMTYSADPASTDYSATPRLIAPSPRVRLHTGAGLESPDWLRWGNVRAACADWRARWDLVPEEGIEPSRGVSPTGF